MQWVLICAYIDDDEYGDLRSDRFNIYIDRFYKSQNLGVTSFKREFRERYDEHVLKRLWHIVRKCLFRQRRWNHVRDKDSKDMPAKLAGIDISKSLF